MQLWKWFENLLKNSQQEENLIENKNNNNNKGRYGIN